MAPSFWADALGWKSTRLSDPDDANYRRLETPRAEVQVLVPAVNHPSRMHLDIETNDVEAEVRRLERLGAPGCAGKAPAGHGSANRPTVTEFRSHVSHRKG